MRQSQLDKEMIELGKERYWSKVNRTKDTEVETYSPVAKRLLGESIELLEASIKDWIVYSETGPGRKHRVLPYFYKLPTDLMAALTARTVLDGISQRRTLTAIAVRIGQYLEDEYRFRKIQEEEPDLWATLFTTVNKNGGYISKRRYIHKTAKAAGIILPRWRTKDTCAVGIVLIELMREATGLIDIETFTNMFGRSTTTVQATDDLMKWLKEAHAIHEILRPVFMPMVVKPMPWQSIYIGGYHAEELRRRPLVKSYDTAYLQDLNEIAMPTVFKAIGHQQDTGWEVNNEILLTMKYCYENNSAMGDLPSNTDYELPPRPEDWDTNEKAQKQWRRQASQIHRMNLQDKSKRLQLAKVLYLSNKFEDQEFYYPYQLDFRARSYPVPQYLQPQGPDWAKGLLRFSKGAPIETQDDANWLAFHTANTWGLDKRPIHERLEWVYSNEEMFRKIHQDPLEYTQWSTADKPYQFLAAAMEMGEFFDQGYGFVSSLPIAQDASNQGLQIYAMLLRDPEAAYYTNVTPSDTPQDLYQIVADTVIEKLKLSDHPFAQKWVEFGITRKTTKRQTMVLPYGSTKQSCKDYTVEWFKEEVFRKRRDNPFGKEVFRPCIFLSDLIWDSIGDSVTSARMGMDWLRAVARICMDNNVTPMWSVPSGFLVKQLYEKQAKYEVKTSIGGKIRRHRLQRGRGENSARKNINGICPNFVHSLDASLMMRTVNLAAFNGVAQFSMVHDSYATTAAHSGILNTCLKTATVEHFKKNLLADFSKQISALLPIGIELPDIPHVGGLNIEDVLESQYYFA